MNRISLIALLLVSLAALGCGTAPTKGQDPAPAAAAASFTVSNLTVTPNTAKPGDRVMVGVTVTNTGSQAGTYSVVVKDHDGSIIGMQDVTVDGGANKNVTLHVVFEKAGAHMVMVENLEANVAVEDAMAMPPTQPVTTPPTQPVTTPPTQPPPATGQTGFTVLKVEVDPTMPDLGEDCILAVTLKNNGAQQGTYKIEVKIDGNTVATKDITLAAGETKNENVPFKAPTKEGNFKVSVGDQTVGMSVMAM